MREAARRHLGLALRAGTLGAIVAGALAALWAAAGLVLPPDAARALAVIRPEPVVPAPDFQLSALPGRRVRLGEFRGKVVLVNFWATWCAPCREEMPALERIARDLGPRGLVVLAVNVRETAPEVGAFVEATGLRLSVLLDLEGVVAGRYRAVALPATYLVSRRGELVGMTLGIRDWTSRAARAYLDGLLAAGA